MPEPVTLEEAKKHLRVEHDDEDDLIQGLITTAREYCEGFQNISLISGEDGGDPPLVSARVKLAMLLLLTHWYEHREAVNIGNITSEVPMGVEALLWQDRNVPI